jgi:hypothetical protein
LKVVRLLAFRGVGFRNPLYDGEPALIKMGHVGLQFEGDPVIYGFRPTPEAMSEIGSEQAVIDWLRDRKPLEGAIFDDTAVFRRAHELSVPASRHTRVYVAEYHLSDDEFDTIRAQLLEWHMTGHTFLYALPQRGRTPMPSDRENCATFPRRLGLAIPEATGHLQYYIENMIANLNAVEWQSEG